MSDIERRELLLALVVQHEAKAAQLHAEGRREDAETFAMLASVYLDMAEEI
jgi:hypothetical protein